MKILYFTATGNSLYVAKKFNGELISIPKAIKEKRYEFEDDKIGIMFPVFGLCVPPYILEFLKKVKLRSLYKFAIFTYGFYDGGTADELIKVSEQNGIHFNYVNKIKMVENYLPGFEMTKEIKKSQKYNVDENIKKIISDIDANKEWHLKNIFIDKFFTRCHQKSYKYNTGVGFTDTYKVEDKCSGCGVCSLVCPTDNINIVNNKPVFGDKCISCLACTQNCTKNAIRLKGEKSSARFRNKSVTLNEIVASNN